MGTGLSDPWLDRTWKLISAAGPSLPLIVRHWDENGKLKTHPNGNLVLNKGDNEFELVKTGTVYKVKPAFKNKTRMTDYWQGCSFVPRGVNPLVLEDADGNTLAPL